MLTNYLTIAWRNLRKHPGYAAINIVGLAVGIACCLLIGLYVHHERSYDRFHTHADQTYRVLREFAIPDLHTTIATTPSALAPALVDGVPAVEAAVRVSEGSPVVQHGAQQFVEPRFLTADDGFFDVFSFSLVRGAAALDQPGTLVLTEAMAAKYFPGADPIGQTLRVGSQELEVTGVLADLPSNTHLRFDFVASLQVPPDQLNWGINNYLTYVRLADGASTAAVTHQVAEAIAANRAAWEAGGNDFIPHLQPITGIHLGQGVPVEIGSQGNILYVYLFSLLAGFIVLLACINFMNLSTARSATRAREVGMRKMLGARRGQLAVQFLGESVLMSLLALVLALLLCELALPVLNQLAGTTLALQTLYDGPQVLVLLGLVMGVGLLAGSYPALVLSGFRPAQVLKGAAGGGQGRRLRKGLVVFQFAISVVIIAGTAVVQHQLRFLRSAGLGFDDQNVVVIEQAGYLGDQVDAFKQEAAQVAGVAHVTSGFSLPGTFFINSMWRPVAPDAAAHNLDYTFVDFAYVETLGIAMAAGRSFSPAFATDSMAVLLNETAVRDFGWTPEEAVGQKIAPLWGDAAFTVVGVTNDFHYRSLHTEIYPLALFAPRRPPRYVAARVAPESLVGTLDALRATWQQFSDLPFSATFLADDLAAQYQAEERLATIFGVFAGLAMLIACLGLLGLAAFTAARRTKEIGVRKVLGASVASIVALLSQDVLKLVLAAILVAAPLAYLAMDRWLADFAYRIDLGPGVFLLAGAAALAIALLTVSYHALRAATTNPVDALRYE